MFRYHTELKGSEHSIWAFILFHNCNAFKLRYVSYLEPEEIQDINILIFKSFHYTFAFTSDYCFNLLSFFLWLQCIIPPLCNSAFLNYMDILSATKLLGNGG